MTNRRAGVLASIGGSRQELVPLLLVREINVHTRGGGGRDGTGTASQ